MAKTYEEPTGTVLDFGHLPTKQFALLLQDEAKRNAGEVPKQKCEETFTTKGRFEADFKGELTGLASLAFIFSAYKDAEDKASRFCKLLSEAECQEVKFVKYDSFDSHAKAKEGGGTAFVELVIVWKCVKKK